MGKSFWDFRDILESNQRSGARPLITAITGGIDAYAIVTKALVTDLSSPEMHFATALMTIFSAVAIGTRRAPARSASRKHDALLAKNLSTHFQ
jgi:hypothetical protein